MIFAIQIILFFVRFDPSQSVRIHALAFSLYSASNFSKPCLSTSVLYIPCTWPEMLSKITFIVSSLIGAIFLEDWLKSILWLLNGARRESTKISLQCLQW